VKTGFWLDSLKITSFPISQRHFALIIYYIKRTRENHAISRFCPLEKGTSCPVQEGLDVHRFFAFGCTVLRAIKPSATLTQTSFLVTDTISPLTRSEKAPSPGAWRLHGFSQECHRSSCWQPAKDKIPEHDRRFVSWFSKNPDFSSGF
jgi:hypothetical protein